MNANESKFLTNIRSLLHDAFYDNGLTPEKAGIRQLCLQIQYTENRVDETDLELVALTKLCSEKDVELWFCYDTCSPGQFFFTLTDKSGQIDFNNLYTADIDNLIEFLTFIREVHCG